MPQAAVAIGAAIAGAAASRAFAPDAPSFAPDPLSVQLQQAQLEAIQEQRAAAKKQQKLLDIFVPQQLKAAGYNPVYDTEGSLVGVERDPEFAEIESELRGKTLKALRGELEVNPAVERELRRGEETLRERLRQQLGPGYETSTAGIEALSRYETGARETRYGVQRGELTLAESLGLARAQAEQARLGGILQAGLGGVAAFGQPGFQSNLGPAGLAAAYQSAALRGQAAAGFGQLAGTLLTAPSSSILGRLFAGGGGAYDLPGPGYNTPYYGMGQDLGQPDFSAGYY
jgi:hypothetical protein